MFSIRIAQIIAFFTFFTCMATTSLAAPKVVVVQASGSILIDNPTAFAFDIYLDQTRITSVSAESTIRLKGVQAGNRAIKTLFRGKMNVPGQDFSVFIRPDRTRKIELSVPAATLTVFNPNPFSARLKVPGYTTRVLAPHATATIVGVEPGRTPVRLEAKNRLVREATIFLSPGKQARWTPTSWTGKVKIHNPGSRTIRVQIDGEMVGLIGPGVSRKFSGITPGFTQVSMTPKGGHKKILRSLYISPENMVSLQAPTFPVVYTKGKMKKGKKKVKVTKTYKKKKVFIAQW